MPNGVCASGTTPGACGLGGATCTTCSSGLTCEASSGVCRAVTGGRSGTGGGGGFDIGAGGSFGGAGGSFEPVTTAYSPAPISGGTLSLMDDDTALVVDADRERLWKVTLSTGDIAWVQFPAGSRPRRAVAEPGVIHVLLRGAGTIAHLNTASFPARGASTELWQVDAACPEPRDLALDPSTGGLLTTCRDGTVVHLKAGVRTETHHAADLRDIIVEARGVSFSSFLRAGLLGVDGRTAPSTARASAEVAWRSRSTPGGILMLHQLAQTEPILVRTGGGYGAGSGGLDGGIGSPGCMQSAVSSALTLFTAQRPITLPLTDVLAVDLAVFPRSDGMTVAVAAAGGSGLSLYDLRTDSLTSTGCPVPFQKAAGQFTGVAFTRDGRLVAHERAGSTLRIVPLDAVNTPKLIRYATDSVDSEGSRLFHLSPAFSQRQGAAVTCASCHPEATEDGHTWNIDGQPRRTQNLVGGVTGRAPFHWVGDLPTLQHLMGDTFVRRMGGVPPPFPVVQSLAAWLDAQPALKVAPRSEAQRLAGRAAFEKAACASCHAGAQHAGGLADVGTGGLFKTPSLIGVHARTPLMHSGCATSLRARFEDPACGGTRHGNPGTLSATEFEALLGYLEAL